MCPHGKLHHWNPADSPIEFAPLQPRYTPDKPDGFTWRDWLIRGLHTAAELEHLLMVQYLYAAYSVGGEQLSESDQRFAGGWQDILLAIAKEEMGHLLTVQNILCFVGGPVRFDRDVEAGVAPFPFRLEPLSADSIARYICGEMPEFAATLLSPQVSAKDLELIKKWIQEGKRSRHAGPPVGELYKLLRAILANPEYVDDSEFRPETYAFQASWDDWGRGYRPPPAGPDGRRPPLPGDGKTPAMVLAEVLIDRVSTRTEALAALDHISGQGEDPKLHAHEIYEESHFVHFLDLLYEFDGAKGESLVRNVPVDPTTELDERHRRPGTTPITQVHSHRWAKLFNLRYRLLLAYLTHSFRHARVADAAAPNTRGLLMHRVFGEMYNIKTLSGLLVRMPLTHEPGDQGPKGRRAGPPFELPYTLSAPLDETDRWKQYRDVLSGAQQICNELLESEGNGERIGPREGAAYLRALLQLDQQTLVWIDGILAGLHPSLGTRS